MNECKNFEIRTHSSLLKSQIKIFSVEHGSALIKQIVIIVNQMLNTGIFPDKLKILKIIPI